MPLITLVLLVILSSEAVSQDLTLWNRNYDTAPIDQVLELAFAKTEDLHEPVRLIRSRPMEQGEAIENLALGKELDLLSAAASSKHEERFLTIRFPLLKGLLGHRICLIRKEDKALLKTLSTAYDFRKNKIEICQGTDWPDTKVLERNGFILKKSAVYTDMFTMLRSGDCDCFLRGAQEILPEYKQYRHEFAIDEHLVITYKQPGVLYVNKNNKALASRIELGLLRALDDGSFDLLLTELLGKDLSTLALANRRTIYLENPFLPESLQHLENTHEAWYQP